MATLVEGLAQHAFTNTISNAKDIKEIIKVKSVRAKLIFTAFAGLPNSGTSSLLRGVLRLPSSYPPCSGKLDVFPTAFFKDSVKNDGHLMVFEKDDESDAMLLLALAKLLKTKQFKVCMDESTIERLKAEPAFKDDEVNMCFMKFCLKFLKLWSALKESADQEINPLVALTKSQSFINFLDINVNKAVYEYLYIVGSGCNNGFLVNVLDIYYYSAEVLQDPLDLSHEHYEGKYNTEEQSLFNLHPAYHYFTSTIEATFSQHRHERRGLMVGTNIDKFDDAKKSDRRIKEVKEVISKCAHEAGIDNTTMPRIMPISNVNNEENHYKNVFRSIISMIEARCGHNNYVLLKYMFFYSVLKNTSKMFITRQAAELYGEKCEMEKEEVNECLQLLHDSCSVFCINKKFVILNIPEFIGGLDLLYSRSCCLSQEDIYNLNHGILPYKLLYSIWEEDQGDVVGTYTLYTTILTDIKLMMRLDGEFPSFLMPSLRNQCEKLELTSDSDSLIVQYNISLLPFHYLNQFFQCFQTTREITPVTLVDCLFYNVLEMKFKECFRVKLLIYRRHLEISINVTEQVVSQSQIEEAYAIVKLCCTKVLDNICTNDIPALKYKFSIICPIEHHEKLCYVELKNDQLLGKYECEECGNQYFASKRKYWITSSSPKNSPQNGGIQKADNQEEKTTFLNSRAILTIADSWTEKPDELAKVLKVECHNIESSDNTNQTMCAEILHLWSRSNQRGNQYNKLAEIFELSEYYVMASLCA